jgi:hypothetical protein
VLDIEPNRTYGRGIAVNYEFFGLDTSVGTGINFGLSGYFDNYRGFGISHTVGLSAQTKSEGTTAVVGLDIGEDTLEGALVGASASLSLSYSARFGADLAFDSGLGLSALSFSVQANYQQLQLLVSTGNILNYLGYRKPAALPGTGREMQGTNVRVTIKGGRRPQPIAPQLTPQLLSGFSPPAAFDNNYLVTSFFCTAGDHDPGGQAVAVEPTSERVPRVSLIQAFTNSDLRAMAKALSDVSANVTMMDTNPASGPVRAAHRDHSGRPALPATLSSDRYQSKRKRHHHSHKKAARRSSPGHRPSGWAPRASGVQVF